jgi:hypothetical protein
MKQFRLSKQTPGETITKFFVYDSAGDTVGIISVPNEDAADLAKHWLGSANQPKVAAAAATPVGGKRNPMIDAIVRNAPKNRLSKQAILRSC